MTLLLILLSGLFIPELFKKLKVPYVTSIMLIGAVMGPFGLGYVGSDEVISFLGFLGSMFLMLMAGLETKMSTLSKTSREILQIAAANSTIPFVIGFAAANFLGYGSHAAFMLGIIFISSSMAVVVPSIEAYGLERKKIGQAILATVALEDMFSLFAISLWFQNVSRKTLLPISTYLLVVLTSLFIAKNFLPKIAAYYKRKFLWGRDQYEKELRFVIIVLIAALIYFEVLGMHPIVAAFLTGFLLSDVMKEDVVLGKLHTMGYGLFIPIFFFIVGMEMDLAIFINMGSAFAAVLVIVTSLIFSKFLGGWFGGRMAGFNNDESMLVGAATIPQLSTTLAVAFSASAVSVIDSTMLTAIIALSIVTTFLSPFLFRRTMAPLATEKPKKVVGNA